MPAKRYQLRTPQGSVLSDAPGTLGGYAPKKIWVSGIWCGVETPIARNPLLHLVWVGLFHPKPTPKSGYPKIFGRLDCASAARAIANGGYVRHRVFFADEAPARASGFRPCARCLPEAYQKWKRDQPSTPPPRRRPRP